MSRQALSDGYRTLGTSGRGPRGGRTRHLSPRRTATVLSGTSEGGKEWFNGYDFNLNALFITQKADLLLLLEVELSKEDNEKTMYH